MLSAVQPESAERQAPSSVESASKGDIFEENMDRVSKAFEQSTEDFAKAVEKADERNDDNEKWQTVKKNLKTTFLILGRTLVTVKDVVVRTGQKVFSDDGSGEPAETVEE